MSLKNLTSTAILICAALILSGCANEGSTVLKKVSEAEVEGKIFVGKTTRDQVRAMYGSPLETSYTDTGLEIWKYQYDDTTGLNVENIASQVLTLGLAGSKHTGDRKELVVLFDEKNIVKRFNMSVSPVTKGKGLF